MKQTVCAIARLQGGTLWPHLGGVVRLQQMDGGVMVEVRVWGLPETNTNFFAFHIHQGESCAGADFSDSDGHFNPTHQEHPNHAGDLPPLLGACGNAYMKVFTNRFSVEDVIGRTVIVHHDPDDFHTQPSGNAGTKIACGVIRKT